MDLPSLAPAAGQNLALAAVAMACASIVLASARLENLRGLIIWLNLFLLGGVFIRVLMAPAVAEPDLPVALDRVEWATLSGLALLVAGAFVTLCQMEPGGSRAPSRYREGLAFAAMASIWVGLSVLSVLAIIIALQLLSVVFLRLAATAPGFQRRALLPMGLIALTALFGCHSLGAAILMAQLGTHDLPALYAAVQAAPDLPVRLGAALLLIAASGQVIWFIAVYLASVRAGMRPFIQSLSAGLILPGAAFLGARFMPFGAAVGPGEGAAGWAGVVGLAVWGLFMLRALTARFTAQTLVGFIISTGCLLVLFYALLDRGGSRHAVLGLVVCLSLGGAVLGLFARLLDRTAAPERLPGAMVTAACGLTGLAISGVPPFIGFWAHWSFARNLIVSGPLAALALVALLLFGLIIAWAVRWVPVWRAAIAGASVPVRAIVVPPLHLGIASFLLTILAMFSVWPDALLAGAGSADAVPAPVPALTYTPLR